MSFVRPCVIRVLSFASLVPGCSSSGDERGGPRSSEACDQNKIGDDCTCDDESEGTYECDDDALTCVCDSAELDDEDDDGDEDAPASRDGGRRSDAGKSSGTDAGTSTARDAGRGTGGDAGRSTPTRDAGAAPGRDAGEAPQTPGSDGSEPVLPEIQGECPEFRDGTVMVAGHRGIELQVGEAGEGGALLFYWHGTGSSAGEANRLLPSAVRDEIISGGGIIASFDGRSSAGTGSDCSGTGAHNMADFDAADQIVACAVEHHGIDPRRIYATGCSAGGLQSGCMAMMRSNYMAAVAPNSGGVVFPQRWQETGKPAVLTMHGGSSDWVIVSFSDTSRTFDDAAKTRGGFVVNCNHGGGHCAASSELQTAAWQFMKDHPFGVSPQPYADGLPSGFPSYCEIF